jgi:radical SAM superfamily enzyme YgiQ (UPF0313 family)
LARVILINPSLSSFGYSFFTPRWLFVLASATPVDLVGDPIIVDEALSCFDPGMVRAGDIVGIGINSGNCLQGYRIVRAVRARGADAIVGGVHATIFPDEPLEMGASAVVTGNGDLVWRHVVEDALGGRLKKKYDGGRVAGESLVQARWDLLDPSKYLFATVQTVAGCPENCSFCSVWVTDGRQPRRRLTSKIIEEVNQLADLGYRFIAFADDNFNPATRSRIDREPSAARRREFERLREERLQFFAEYDRSVPTHVRSITQTTYEVVDDEEYISAMYHQARIRAVLIGVESFNPESLARVNKTWNASGEQMVARIRKFQEWGILVLSSIITGLETDTRETLETMRRFATNSGTLLAQFTHYSPYPGTKDYFEMVQDMRARSRAVTKVKRSMELLQDRFWLTSLRPPDYLGHPLFSRDELLVENKRSWDDFYSFKATRERTRGEYLRKEPWIARAVYVCACLAFKRIYAGHGISADSVRRRRLGLMTRALVKLGVRAYSLLSRRKRLGVSGPRI